MSSEEISGDIEDPTNVWVTVEGYLERMLGRKMDELIEESERGIPGRTFSSEEIDAMDRNIFEEVEMSFTASEADTALKLLIERRDTVKKSFSKMKEAEGGSPSHTPQTIRSREISSVISRARKIMAAVWNIKTAHE